MAYAPHLAHLIQPYRCAHRFVRRRVTTAKRQDQSGRGYCYLNLRVAQTVSDFDKLCLDFMGSLASGDHCGAQMG